VGEWIAYSKLEPWDETRMDIRFAQLMALTANINIDSKKQKPYTAKDFMPDFLSKSSDQQQPQSVEELKQAMMELAGRMNSDG